MLEGYKTYIGIAVAFAGATLQQLNVNIAAEDIQPVVDAGLMFGGLAVAAYGRFKAKPKIKG